MSLHGTLEVVMVHYVAGSPALHEAYADNLTTVPITLSSPRPVHIVDLALVVQQRLECSHRVGHLTVQVPADDLRIELCQSFYNRNIG